MKVIKNYGFSNEQVINEVIVENNATIDNKKVRVNIEKGIKRLVDIIAGLVGTILLIPITICIYIAKKILKEDDGPIFYDHLRIGKDGKTIHPKWSINMVKIAIIFITSVVI